ncbi:unnamed protein product [Cylicocyclus nassatus]|uniref:EGF-like domain-containing protein n=1 Tax=Cylicocyclus nassatus TaxID=53992 RepID=A0AA36MB42_CYLNA|nr:unnamed protein product [Cylicocyclus nassatus]
MTDILCEPHFSGYGCEWPICSHGQVNPIDRTCRCHGNYAPPFCEYCLPGYWGESCDRRILPAMSEPVLPAFFTHVVLYLIIVFIVISSYLVYDRCRSRPTTYIRVIKDAPPPYYMV